MKLNKMYLCFSYCSFPSIFATAIWLPQGFSFASAIKKNITVALIRNRNAFLRVAHTSKDLVTVKDSVLHYIYVYMYAYIVKSLLTAAEQRLWTHWAEFIIFWLARTVSKVWRTSSGANWNRLAEQHSKRVRIAKWTQTMHEKFNCIDLWRRCVSVCASSKNFVLQYRRRRRLRWLVQSSMKYGTTRVSSLESPLRVWPQLEGGSGAAR